MSRGLRALNRITDFLKVNAKHWKQDVSYIEKDLQALEIIRNAEDVDKKIILALFGNGVIPQEKYDLLKEVIYE